MKLRVQLDDYHDGQTETVAFTIDTAILDRLTIDQRGHLEDGIQLALWQAHVDEVVDPLTALAAEVTRRIADARAYKREAARRGVLAL